MSRRWERTMNSAMSELAALGAEANIDDGHDIVVCGIEHQTQMHNLITKASYLTRIAVRDQAEMNKALGLSDAQYGLAAAVSIFIFFIVAGISAVSFWRTRMLEEIR